MNFEFNFMSQPEDVNTTNDASRFVPERDEIAGGDFFDLPDPFGAMLIPASTVSCRRCGLSYSESATKCPHCAASNPTYQAVAVPQEVRSDFHSDWSSFKTLLFSYFILLGFSVIWAWCVWFGKTNSSEELAKGTVIVEALDAGVVLILFCVIGRCGVSSRSITSRLAAWFFFPAVLCLALVLNKLYCEFLQSLLPKQEHVEPHGSQAFEIATICLQPAIIEELFFRYFAFGILRKVTTQQAAIWTSAAMFSLAHLYNPLGMPYLFLLGAMFGYFRVSGGLALPMVMHFIHNFVVITWFER